MKGKGCLYEINEQLKSHAGNGLEYKETQNCSFKGTLSKATRRHLFCPQVSGTYKGKVAQAGSMRRGWLPRRPWLVRRGSAERLERFGFEIVSDAL